MICCQGFALRYKIIKKNSQLWDKPMVIAELGIFNQRSIKLGIGNLVYSVMTLNLVGSCYWFVLNLNVTSIT